MMTPDFIEESFPFLVALALLGALMLLELVMLLLGNSLLSNEPDFDLAAPQIDIDLDVSAGDLDGFALEPGELAEIDLDPGPAEVGDAAPSAGMIHNFLGLGNVPTVIWLAALLLAFGLIGVWGQFFAMKLLQAPLSLWASVPIVGVLAFGFARKFGQTLAKWVPRFETSAKSERHLGRSRGIVSQGIAARGRPAEVRVVDGYGNIHHIRAEPLRDNTSIAEGSEVLVLRHKHSAGYRIIALSEK